MPLIRDSEKRYILDDRVHPDGSRTLILRNSTPFNVKKRIVDRFNKENLHATLYSDNRIEASGTQMMERSQ